MIHGDLSTVVVPGRKVYNERSAGGVVVSGTTLRQASAKEERLRKDPRDVVEVVPVLVGRSVHG